VGAPCFSRGEQRFSVAQRSSTSIMRFSAGLENPGLKPSLKKETLFRWTEVQLPLLKQGAPIKLGAERSPALFRFSCNTPIRPCECALKTETTS
jgi:hypothetical protein